MLTFIKTFHIIHRNKFHKIYMWNTIKSILMKISLSYPK